MKNKIVLILAAVVFTGLFAASIIFFLKSNTLTSQLEHTKQVLAKTTEEVKRSQAEKEKLTKENDKLQADTISYVSVNNDLTKDKDGLQEQLKEAQKIVEEKEAQIERMNKKVEDIEKKLSKVEVGAQEKLQKEKKELEGKLKSLEETLQKERGLYHYNLAVSYSQAKLYDEAVASYEKSLTFNPNNPEAHYNLGYLYGNIKSDPDKAALHYQKYLELKPDAEDKEEVLGFIDKLK